MARAVLHPGPAEQRLAIARRLRADAERRADLAERELAAALLRERVLLERLDELEGETDTELDPAIPPAEG